MPEQTSAQASRARRIGILGWVVLSGAVVALGILGARFLPLPQPGVPSPTLELVSAGTPVTQAHYGETLTLMVRGAGHPAVAVFTINDGGEVVLVLPSTPIPEGGRVPVGKGFTVPGQSLAVVACFGAHPLPIEALRSSLFARGLRTTKTPRDLVPPDGCARTRLDVVP